MLKYSTETGAIVDGEQWYQCLVDGEVLAWLRSLNSDNWYEHVSEPRHIVVDVHEHVYAMMVLRWN